MEELVLANAKNSDLRKAAQWMATMAYAVPQTNELEASVKVFNDHVTNGEQSSLVAAERLLRRHIKVSGYSTQIEECK